MKKILTVLVLVMFMSTANAAVTNITSKLNNGLNAINQKEQALNKKIDNAQAQREAQKQAAAKKQAEQKAAAEKAKKDAQAKADAQKKAINDTKTNTKNTVNNAKNAAKNEANYWKNLGK